MKKWFAAICFLFLMLALTGKVLCQDSLYLVGTITGESVDKKITDVKAIGDVNGDGYDDFIVTTVDNEVKLYLGSSTINLTPSVIFHYPGTDSLHSFVGGSTGIGDVNGDGYNDFLIRGGFGDWGSPKGKVFLYYGGPIIDTIPKFEFYEPWVQDAFGLSMEGVGDINKDGFNDFVISSPYNWTNGVGRVYLFFGGDTISFTRSLTFLSGKSEDYFGQSTANVGDINGDGYADIAIGAPNTLSSSDSGKVYFYFSNNIMDTTADRVLAVNPYYAGFIKNGGDINGDGVIDYYVGGRIFLGIDNIIFLNRFYDNLEASGDINNDGYCDFVIGSLTYKNSENIMVGGVFGYLGSNNIDTVYKFRLEGENKWDNFSSVMSFVDINGDGYDELLILAPGYPDYNNPQGKVYIYSYNKLNDIKDQKIQPRDDFELSQNYPNPFNPTTMIEYHLPVTNHVKLKVYDILGRVIETLVDEIQKPGVHRIHFDASTLSSGIYFYRLVTEKSVFQKEMVLIK